MQLCEYVFAMGFPLCVPNKWGFGGEDVKVLCSDPQKALPCVNKRLLVYRMSKSVQRFKLQVQGMILHTNKEIKKLSDNFGQYRIQRGGWGMHPPHRRVRIFLQSARCVLFANTDSCTPQPTMIVW